MSDDATQTMQPHRATCGCATCRAGAPAAASPQAGLTEWGSGGQASFTSQSYIDALLAPGQYRWNAAPAGSPLTLSYGFMTSMPGYAGPPYELGGFQTFNSAQQEGVHRAVRLFEEICNVDFVFQPIGNTADVRFGAAILPDAEAAHTYYPFPNADWAGDIWFNTEEPAVYVQSDGSYGFMVTLHEMGHALGLKHPFDSEAGAETTLPFDQDNRQYTVMSYYQHPTVGEEPASLLLYDIAALQYLYGANTATRSSDTNYQWGANEQFIYCIWDGGGSDTIDASNQTRRVVIDLNPGTFSSVGANGGADALNNLSIAYGASIENARGGSGHDTITGNQLANRLEGGSGNDTIRAGAGHDLLIGGAGADWLDGGADIDTVSYVTSTAAVFVNLSTGTASGGHASGDTLIAIEKLEGSVFDDVLIGDSGGNWLDGGAGNDVLDGGAGMDTYFGGAGDDVFVLDTPQIGSSAGEDNYVFENPGEGIDEIRTTANKTGFALRQNVENLTFIGSGDFEGYGNDHDNRITGGAGNDTLNGGYGNDTLIGGSGNDLLVGFAGADALIGGDGFDTAAYVDSSAVRVDLAGGVSEGHAAGDTFSGIEAVIGSRTYADHLLGDDGDNVFTGLGGDDVINGRGGNNTAVYFGTARDYEVTESGGVKTVRALRSSIVAIDGVDTLTNVQTIRYESVYVNRAPVITGGSGQVFRSTARPFHGLLSFSDADGDIIERFELRDLTLGAGHLINKGAIVAPNQTVSLARHELADLEYYGGNSLSASDRIEARVSDGVDWSEWAVIQITPVNRVPFVATQSMAPSHGTFSIAASTLFTPSDPDGDPIVSYEFRDNTAGHGYFRVGGVQQAATFQALAGQLPGVEFVPASTAGDQDFLEIRAFDGYGWGDWRPVFVNAVPNVAPTVSASDTIIADGTYAVAAGSLFSINDADGDAMARYEFRDDTAGGGHFSLGGVAQGSQFQVGASQLTGLTFVAGSLGGSDSLSVRVSDGYAWSGWASFTATSRSNAAPAATATDRTLARGENPIAAAALFSFDDPDEDPIRRYRVYDGTAGNGAFELNGTPVAERKNFEFDVADLPNLRFRSAGAAGATDLLWVQASDGMAWSAWKSFTVVAPVNNAPVIEVNTAALTPGKGTSSVLADDFFSVTDADGDAIIRYKFYDGTAGNGFFTSGGTQLAALTNHVVEHAVLGTIRYVTSTTGVGDTLWVQAFDGIAWGAWKSFTVAAPRNAAPEITVNAAALSPAKGTVSVLADDFFNVADADDDAIIRYKFYDGTLGSGGFTIGGQAQIERTNLTVEHADLATIRYVTGATGAGDTLWVQAFDGTVWSAWASFNVAAPANIAPTVTVQNLEPEKGTTGIAGADLFDVIDPDDANTAIAYRFYDGTAGNGRFYLGDDPAAERLNIDVTAAQLGDFEYRTSATGAGDTLWVQAFDGMAWSAWKSFTVAAPVNIAPIVTVADLAPAQGAVIAGKDLFSLTDPDDADTAVAYKFYDGTIGNGAFYKGGVLQAERLNIDVTSEELADFEYRTSTDGGDTLWVQAYDGFSWSAWKSFTAGPRPAAMAGQSVNAMASQLAAAESLTASTMPASGSGNATLWSEQRLTTLLLAPT